MGSSPFLVWLALAALAGCRSDRASELAAADHGTAQSTMQSLEESLSPLRDRFNDDQGKLRFIALLSPT